MYWLDQEIAAEASACLIADDEQIEWITTEKNQLQRLTS